MSAETNDFYQRIAKLSPQRLALLAMDLKAKLDAVEQASIEPIAIVGMACRFPGAESPEAFWTLLQNGTDAITEVPASRWDVQALYDPDPEAPGKMSTRWGGFLRDIDRFDAQFFGIAPREALTMDPQQRLLLEVSWEALEDAGQAPDRLTGSATGVFTGLCNSDYFNLLLQQQRGAIDAYLATGNSHSVASGRLSYQLGLQGPSVSLDTACSSSLVAVHLACQSLLAGDCRMALAGAVNVMLLPDATITLSKAHMMAPDGRCKAFDASANGFVRAEGCAIVVLKKLAHALEDGDRIQAIIRGSAVNQDGRSSGLTAPNGPAQEAVIRQALARARVEPSEISYVEAHGTGTALGDPIEVRALGSVFAGERPTPLLIGSVKTNIGHLESTAGMAGLLKTVLALKHEAIPKTLHVRALNPHIEWDALPLRVVTELTPWPAAGPRRLGGVSSFGFSGTNAHVVVEAAPVPAASAPHVDRPRHLLVLSAKSHEALRELAARYQPIVAAASPETLANICFTANSGRQHFGERVAVAGESAAALAGDLAAVAAGQSPAGAVKGTLTVADPPEIAFLFTGQGSQYSGMAQRLYDTHPVFRAALERCDAIARRYVDRPLLSTIYPETDDALIDETAYTQPALFAIEYALAELWRSWGVTPTVVAGHSVGEFAAACVAGVFGLEDGIKLVAARGRLMQALPRDGAMVAVFAPEERVARALVGHEAHVSLAAVNGPSNVVISGRRDAVDAIAAALRAQGVGSRPLTVSHAFHSPLMDPMLDAFERVAMTIDYAPPRLAVVSNITGRFVQGDEITSASYWRRHARAPVRFEAMVRTMDRHGLRLFVEVGPSPILSDMARQCLPDSAARWLASVRRGRDDWTELLKSLAVIYTSGASIDWAGFDAAYMRRRVALPSYPFQRQRYWPSAELASHAVSSPRDERSHQVVIGRRLATAAADAVFETRLGLHTHAFLKDHRIQGRVIVPGPWYLEMALAGGSATLGTEAVELCDVTILAPLELRDDEERTVQWVGRREDADTVSFELFGLVDGPDAPTWTLHASGRAQRVSSSAVDRSARALDPVRARCEDEVPVADYYANLRAHGIDFGPGFQGVRRLWRRDGEALGHVVLDESLVAGAGAYALHPAVLDAGFQTLGAGLRGLGGDGPRLPYLMIGVERLRVLAAGCTEVWAHATLRPGTTATADMLTADLHLLDPAGHLVTELEGVRLRRASGDNALGDRRRLGDWLYHMQWRPQEHAGDDTSASRRLIEPTDVAARVEPGVPELRSRFRLDDYRELVRELDALATAYAVQAMRRLVRGWAIGARIATDQPPFSSRGHLPRVLRRVVDMLEQEGVLTRSGSEWVVARNDHGPAPSEYAATLRSRFASYDAELTLVTRCGERLADVLSGVCDPLQLLFPDGSTTVAEQLAQDSPPARAYNTLVHTAFAAALVDVPAGCPVRILEIGAGTGGTTTAVLPAVAPHRAEYVFSDISQLFLARARDKYARYPFVSYEMLDIEVDPARQGFDGRRFDIVLAANVLHATADLERTLSYVRRMMAPGGLLVLLEGTASQRWVDLTYGLTSGWWKFSDHARRPAHPLLTASSWLGLLADTGFDRPAIIGDSGGGQHGLAQQAIVIARNPDGARANPVAPVPRRAWLILADRGGVGERLRDVLATRGHTAIVVRAQDEIDLASLDGLERLIQSAALGGREPLQGVVHLLGLDAASSEHTSTAALEAAATLTCRSALFAVQALAKATGDVRPRLWLVTRGAQAIGPTDRDLELAQSPLWGLGRVAAMEHPEIWGGLLDLDATPTHDEAEALVAELLAVDHEDQVALRQNGRHVARLVRLRPYQPARASARFRDDATYLLTGGVGGMGLEVARWMVERGARHLALLARRAPTSTARIALDEIERLGAQLLVAQADVAHEPDLARVLDDIAGTMPPVRGIIHAAGIFDDRVLLRHDWERFARVLRPKLNGAWNLHRLTRGMPLDFFVLFSSAASFMGPVGLANYTAANVFLDALAHRRRRAGLPALSINWGPWYQVGMAEAVGAVRQSQWTAGGFGTMPAAEALEVLGDLLQQDITQVGVLPAEWSRYMATFASGREPRMFSELVREDRLRAEARSTTTAPESDFHRRLETVPVTDRRTLVTALVTEHVIRVLGFDAAFALGPQQRFFEIGMDSLTAVELKNRLQAFMKRPLPSTLVFDYPTVESLATYLGTQLLGLAPTPPPSVPAEPNAGTPSTNDIANLSEDELTSLLAEKLRQIG